MKRLAALILIFLFVKNIDASTYLAGSLTYRYVSDNSYVLVYKTVRDCRSTPLNNFSVTVFDGGNQVALPMTRVSIRNVTLNNPGACNPQNKSGGQGNEEHTYECLIDLDTFANGLFLTPCKLWFGVSFCCRNGAINTYSAGNGFVECMLDRCLAAENSGPVHFNTNFVYMPKNLPSYYNPYAFDTTDGDLLEYVLSAPMYDFGQYEVFNTGYSEKYPLSPLCTLSGQKNCTPAPLVNPPRGIYQDSLNGNMIFTPTNSSEVSSLCYRINEYRYINGIKKLIGYYIMDNEVIIPINSARDAPVLSKKTLKLNHFFTVGKQDTIRFEIQQNDTFKVDSVRLFCFNPIKGSSVSIDQDWRPSGIFTWKPSCSDARKEPYSFLLYFHNENQYVSQEQSIAFNIYVKPDLSLGNDTLICENGSFLLNANITGKYMWNGDTRDSFRAFKAQSGGKYWLDVTRNGCTVSDTIVLSQISGLPSIGLGKDTLICNLPPQSIITLSTAYQKDVRYTWDADTNDKYSVLHFTGTGRVILKGENVCGTDIDTIQVSRMNAPVILLPHDTTVCNPFELALKPDTKNGGSLLWGDLSTDTIQEINTAGNYWVEMKNNCGVSRDSISISAFDDPKPDLGRDTIICNGKFPYLDAHFPNGHYQWSTGDTTSSLQTTAGGIYTVRVSNYCGIGLDTIIVDAQVNPVVDLGKDTMLCVPFALDLDATFNKSSYMWSNGSTDAVTTISQPGTYFVTISNACGMAQDTIDVGARQKPLVSLGRDTAMKQPFVLKLDANVAADYYVWSTGDTTSWITASNFGTYWVKAGNSCGESSDTLAIDELLSVDAAHLSGCKLYPIPADNVLFIESKEIIRSVYIYDITGKTVEEVKNLDIYLSRIDINNWRSGVYFLLIESDGHTEYLKFQKL